MGVRVKVRIRAHDTNKEIITSALVNSGFETETPQIVLPVRAAARLGLYPPPPTVRVVELGTAGGPARMYLLTKAASISIIVEDREEKLIICDVLISPIEEEVLINDKLMDELGIMLVKAGQGIWRFIDDPSNVMRKSVPPEYW